MKECYKLFKIIWFQQLAKFCKIGHIDTEIPKLLEMQYILGFAAFSHENKVGSFLIKVACKYKFITIINSIFFLVVP